MGINSFICIAEEVTTNKLLSERRNRYATATQGVAENPLL
jgi:hypothetical protein